MSDLEPSFCQFIESFLSQRRQLGFTLDELEEYVLGQTQNMNTYIDRGGSAQLKKGHTFIRRGIQNHAR